MIFFCQTAIKTALDTLPTDVIVKIVNNIHSHYHEKLSIAAALNQNGYFGSSPHHVLAVLNVKKPNILFACKAFYNMSPIHTLNH